MNRRHFSGLAAAAALSPLASRGQSATPAAFRTRFGPHPQMFPGGPKDYLEQMMFAHDLGFRAWEDNDLRRQPNDVQEKIGRFAREKDFLLGVMVITGGHGMPFFRPTEDGKTKILDDMRAGVEVAKRTGQTCMTMIPGPRVDGVPLDEQITGAVEMMKRCCDIVEEHGIILVQEPLSHNVTGGAPLLRSFEDGFKLCELVNRKSCKLLADFYHEGSIGNDPLPSADKVWSQVAYVQYGDVPGRKEPGSGKLDFKAITRWIHDKGYRGVVGMEHGISAKGKEGLDKLVAAYRAIDIS